MRIDVQAIVLGLDANARREVQSAMRRIARCANAIVSGPRPGFGFARSSDSSAPITMPMSTSTRARPTPAPATWNTPAFLRSQSTRAVRSFMARLKHGTLDAALSRSSFTLRHTATASVSRGTCRPARSSTAPSRTLRP